MLPAADTVGAIAGDVEVVVVQSLRAGVSGAATSFALSDMTERLIFKSESMAST